MNTCFIQVWWSSVFHFLVLSLATTFWFGDTGFSPHRSESIVSPPPAFETVTVSPAAAFSGSPGFASWLFYKWFEALESCTLPRRRRYAPGVCCPLQSACPGGRVSAQLLPELLASSPASCCSGLCVARSYLPISTLCPFSAHRCLQEADPADGVTSARWHQPPLGSQEGAGSREERLPVEPGGIYRSSLAPSATLPPEQRPCDSGRAQLTREQHDAETRVLFVTAAHRLRQEGASAPPLPTERAPPPALPQSPGPATLLRPGGGAEQRRDHPSAQGEPGSDAQPAEVPSARAEVPPSPPTLAEVRTAVPRG
ncbi:uncharacterized protein LOC106505222 [Sus scrofa]|uniref:uncharacterized protein LOC106505222 n=1 Tax=Sus scrofa TaxID=9823 RepID=UPI000A2B110D|nr:uncharacterized protein LOC106505222 [Sus scrofa]